MSEAEKGQLYAILAFLFWGGIAPIYFKEVSGVSALEILSHRIIWSSILLLPLLFLFKEIRVFIKSLSNVRVLKYLLISTLFISLNWLVFIWAIAHNKILEASLGYYINPLVNVFLGYLFLEERMTKNQYIAIIVAALAVLYELIILGSIPYVSLVLAFSFGFYGLIRKKVDLASLVGLSIEVLLLLPMAVAYLGYLFFSGSLAFAQEDTYITWMLTLGGFVTVIPLLLFNGAARRMKLITLGFFQYIGPSVAFLVAVFIYDEPFTFDKLISFILIWIALVIFSLDAYVKGRQKKSIKT